MLRKIKRSSPESGKPDTVRRRVLALASAVLLVFAFPDFDLGFLAWFALVPLLFAMDGLAPRRAFGLAYLSGTAFFLGAVSWLIHVTLPGMVVVALYLGLYVGLFGYVAARFMGDPRRSVYDTLFFLPAAWTVIEFARAHLLTGFGWVLLGHSQAFTLPVIQIADTTGVYGISFLIALVNAAIYLSIKNLRARKTDISVMTIALFLVFLALAYGIIRMKNVFTGEKVAVAVVQGNIPQERKWDSAFREEIVRTYEDLTMQAAAERPDLIVWPETSVPGFLESEPDLLRRVTDLARKAGIPLLVGTVREGKGGDYFNSAVLIAPDGAAAGAYDKVHLVPFGEYIPFKKALSFVEKFAPVPIGDLSPGKEPVVLSFFTRKEPAAVDGAVVRLCKRVQFSCLVCFEDIFPEIARECMKKRAAFLVTITNDAWYKRSSAQFQHAQNSVFRAVENRTTMVRAANTGVSCFIDQKGHMEGIVESAGDIYAKGYSIREITLNRARTFYTVYGDVFVYGCMLVVAFGLWKRRA